MNACIAKRSMQMYWKREEGSFEHNNFMHDILATVIPMEILLSV
jgi:hypothetical protein